MHVEQLPSGSWRVTVTHRGQRRRATAATRALAEIEGGRLLERLGMAGTGTALSELLAEHIARHDYAPTTRSDMARVLDRLPDDVRAASIETITTGWLVALYDRLRSDGWTAHRIVRCHELIGSAFARAVRHDRAPRNPARGAAPKRPAKPRIVPPTDAEVGRLLDHAGPLLPAWQLAAMTGLRRGELVALQWHDLDLEDGALTVRRALAYTPEDGVHAKELKNGDKGHRVIALDVDVTALLRTHRAQRVADRLALGLSTPAESWVFSNDQGETPWRPDYATHRWRVLRNQLGLDHVRLYDVRHYMVTSMLAAGEPLSTVAGRAGHDPVTMLRRYWHFVPASDRPEADRHAARLRAARSSR